MAIQTPEVIVLGDTSQELHVDNVQIATVKAQIELYLRGKKSISFATSQDLRDSIGQGEENPFLEPFNCQGVESLTLVGSELDLCIVDAVVALLAAGVSCVVVLPGLTATKEEYTSHSRPATVELLARFVTHLERKAARHGFKIQYAATAEQWTFTRKY